MLSRAELLRSIAVCGLAGLLVALPVYLLVGTAKRPLLPGLIDVVLRPAYGWFLPFVVIVLFLTFTRIRLTPLRGALIAAGCVLLYLVYATIITRFYWGRFLDHNIVEYFATRVRYAWPGALAVAVGVALSVWITDIFFRRYYRR
jgi:hypothetical protein